MENTLQIWRRFFGSWVLTLENSHFWPHDYFGGSENEHENFVSTPDQSE